MQFGNWCFRKPYEDRDILVTTDGMDLSVGFLNEKYTVLKCTLDVTDLKERYYYRFDASLDTAKLSHRFFYNCYDSEGQEKHKGHLRIGESILIPEGCCRLELELLLFSHTPGTAVLRNVTLTEEGPYVPRKVRLCAVSWDMVDPGVFKTYEENVDNVMKELDTVGPLKPDVVVFTEAVYQTGRDSKRQPKVRFSRLDDEDIAKLCAKAKQYNTYIACSIYEKDPDDLKRLTGLLINRQGQIQELYHKTHLTMGELEDGSILENELPVFDTDFGKVGIQICWDHFFPESTRTLALRGAEVLLIPTHGFRRERTLTRALENGVHLVSAYTHNEGTIVVSPNGKVLDEAGDKGYALAEVDLNEPVWYPWLACNSSAEPNPTYLMERRPELYGDLCIPVEY